MIQTLEEDIVRKHNVSVYNLSYSEAEEIDRLIDKLGSENTSLAIDASSRKEKLRKLVQSKQAFQFNQQTGYPLIDLSFLRKKGESLEFEVNACRQTITTLIIPPFITFPFRFESVIGNHKYSLPKFSVIPLSEKSLKLKITPFFEKIGKNVSKKYMYNYGFMLKLYRSKTAERNFFEQVYLNNFSKMGGGILRKGYFNEEVRAPAFSIRDNGRIRFTGENSKLSTICISDSYNCIIPSEILDKIKEAEPYFRDKAGHKNEGYNHMFLIKEVNKWSVPKLGRLFELREKPDPLIIGVKYNTPFYITSFFNTPLEEYVKGAYVGGRPKLN